MLASAHRYPGVIASALSFALLVTACAPASQPSPTATAAPAATSTATAMMDKAGGGMTKTPDAMMDKSGDSMMMKLPEQQFAAHFVSSLPMHGQKLSAAPASIMLTFDFTLGGSSMVSVTKDGSPLTIGPATVSDDKLTLTAMLPDSPGNGTYVVDYKACWPDNSCHNGKFGFIVGS